MTPAPDTGSCYHCSEQLPADNPHAYDGQLGELTASFCCPACRAVAQTIYGMGLAAYYRQRDSKPLKVIATDTRWQEMDLPAIQSTFVQHTTDGEAEAHLFIPGIHCASCCWLIEHRLQQIPDLVSVHAQLSQQKVIIRWRLQNLPVSRLFLALHEIGYLASPWQHSTRQQLAEQHQRDLLRRTGVAGLAAMQIHMIAMGNYFGADISQGINWPYWMNIAALLLSLPVWFYSAMPFLANAWRQCKAGILGMDLPVAIAIVTAAGASLLALWQHNNDVYFDSIAMFVFLLLGARYLEARARAQLAHHAQPPVMPSSCIRLRDGQREHIATLDLQAGDLVAVNTHEQLAADGTVVDGEAQVEEAALTGEFMPVHKQAGDTVLAGTRVNQGSITVRATGWGSSSQLAQLHSRMESALATKHRHHLHDRMAYWFTPTVLLIAVISALYWAWYEPTRALPALLAVLVASCPCALSLAIPAARTAATLQLRKHGILITTEHALLAAAKIRCWVFDKTGTLTNGRFGLEQVHVLGNKPADLCIAMAAALEANSSHPVASAFAGKPTNFLAHNVQVHPHLGVEGDIDGTRYCLGSPAWLQSATPFTHGMEILLVQDKRLLARFCIGDELRHDAKHLITTLQSRQHECIILTGDASDHATAIADRLNIHTVQKGCSPEAKTTALHTWRHRYGKVAMIGDGINDGPVLATADLSISLAEASQTAKLAADVILLNNRLSDITQLIATSHQANRIARQNVTWALLYNLCILPVAAAGALSPVWAATGMAISSMLVTLNALRLFRPDRRE